jgi:hypothetical protein
MHRDKKTVFFRIYAESLTGGKAELRISSSEERNRREKCEAHGDGIVDLCMESLEKVFRENLTYPFSPEL